MNKTCATSLREMVSYSFLWNSKFLNSLKGYYQAFGMLYGSMDEFMEDFQRITKEKFTCCVYDANLDSLADNYKAYRAPAVIPQFRLQYKI